MEEGEVGVNKATIDRKGKKNNDDDDDDTLH